MNPYSDITTFINPINIISYKRFILNITCIIGDYGCKLIKTGYKVNDA